MLWFLRKSRAFSSSSSLLFNNINNNNNNHNDNRPARKDYNKLKGTFEVTKTSVVFLTKNKNKKYKNKSNENNNVRANDGCEEVADVGVKVEDEEESNFTDLELEEVEDGEDEEVGNRFGGNSDYDDDDDEALTCNVCDRSFASHKELASHQQKKRHFGCSACDSLFPSLMVLEHHKEEFEHWSSGGEEEEDDDDDDDYLCGIDSEDEWERLL